MRPIHSRRGYGGLFSSPPSSVQRDGSLCRGCPRQGLVGTLMDPRRRSFPHEFCRSGRASSVLSQPRCLRGRVRTARTPSPTPIPVRSSRPGRNPIPAWEAQVAAVPVAKVVLMDKVVPTAKALLMVNPVRTGKVPTAKMVLPRRVRCRVMVRTAVPVVLLRMVAAPHQTVAMAKVCLAGLMAVARRRITRVTACRAARQMENRMEKADCRLQLVSRGERRRRVVRVR